MNAFITERLTIELQRLLVGKKVENLFTTSQFEINLVFESIVLKINFFQGQAYFQTTPAEKLQKKNRLPVFHSLKSKRITAVVTFPFDRLFRIDFDGGESLVFYLFGRFGQISHYVSGDSIESFPVKGAKREEQPPKPKTTEDVVQGSASIAEFYFLSAAQREELVSQGYDAKSSSEKTTLLEAIRQQQLTKKIYVNKGEKKYELSLVKGQENISEFDSVLDALDGFSRLYISHQVFANTKASHLGGLTKEANALEKKLKAAERSLKELNRASSYKEKADLLMANLWQIEKRAKEVTLSSFDGERQVSIRLQSILTPQSNAERYYRKAKNESKQRDYASKHLSEIASRLQDKQSEIADFEQLDSLKVIRKKANVKLAAKDIRVPYRRMDIDGYEIRIGKGAKDNDELLRSHTTKFDMWLHAKDVSGSHVIIRNPSKSIISLKTIEKVARIAAYYSKAKSESLAAVIYTERKYIRKPKGALPGLVKVDKETVLLVEPSRQDLT